jgi:hypothetical protein
MKSIKAFFGVLREVLPYVGIFTALITLVVAVAAPLAWLQASQEAAAFNRFTTGPKATAWDALWIELRVEADR